MRFLKPISGANVADLKVFAGRWPCNGASAPAAWTQGGKGMGVPVHASTGTFTIALTDPPGGVLVGWEVTNRCDAIANSMHVVGGTWDATTNTFTVLTAAPATPTTLADPPAAATDREFSIVLLFSQSENL